MRALSLRLLLLLAALAGVSSIASAQTVQKQGTGVITGRVTLGEKPMPNTVVGLYQTERVRDRTSVAKSTTDYDGRYRLTNVPAGRYVVTVMAPAFVGTSEGTFGETGKMVTLAEGETVEKIDFALVRGGVITGRVTDADGSPVVDERVQLSKVEGQERGFYYNNPFMLQTDDRGVYRIYGLTPGRYRVSVGTSSEEGMMTFGGARRGYYTRTFHPGVTEEAKATIIEVGEGTEATGVDITLGSKSKSYVATGRVVDENGKPVASARIGTGSLVRGENQIGAYGWGTLSDANGNFRLEGLAPGRYAAFVWNEGEGENYSETVRFDITEGNVSGLELKLRRGVSISGVVVIEGTTDKATLAKLTQLSLGAYMQTEGTLVTPNFSLAKIAPDGSFRISGLRPGKARLYLGGYPPPQGFTLARVERDGVAQQEIEIAPGAQEVTNVRAVVEYGSGSVRGIVKVENGELPAGARLMLNLQRLGGTSGDRPHVVRVDSRGSFQVDARGRFLIEGLPTGEYEITVHVAFNTTPPRRFAPVKQNVSVTNGVEAQVTMTLNLDNK